MIKILLTNARSLSPKIESLQNMFTEHKLDVAMVTESWLKDSQTLDRDVVDLEHGTNLKIIYKNRPKNAAGVRKVGGGVSVIFNMATCALRERKILGNKYELVSAVGRVGRLTRQVAFFCLYLEPRIRAADVKELGSLVAMEILKLKSKGDPLIFVAGDFNKRLFADELADFPDIKQVNFEPTRMGACLDVVLSNAEHSIEEIWPPLQTLTGIKSDHDCLVLDVWEKKTRKFVWEKRTTRKHTREGLENYGAAMASTDWNTLMPDGATPDDLVSALESRVEELTDRFFPLQTVRCRSNDPPWITNGIRRLAKRKARIFKREGKSPLWIRLRDDQDAMMADSKSAYIERLEDSGTDTRAFFAAVKAVGTAGKKPDWQLLDLFPNMDPKAAADRTAEYFTEISDQFEPLRPEDLISRPRTPLTLEQVQARLRNAKKPASQVLGDAPPRVMKAHHAVFGVPAMRIFNAVLTSSRWPSQWQVETTVVIPKKPAPESLADCRNISCTAFLSKVLEGIVLDDLRGELLPDETQYGGIKNCSVNHLLVDLYDDILRPLDDGNPSVVLGIDYQKAFNRLNHHECLKQLELLGASESSLALVRSFLTGRKMRVRAGSVLSSLRPLCGGSPQGSILGCLLYCVATQQLNEDLAIQRATSSPGTPDAQMLITPPTPLSSPEVGMGIRDRAMPLSSSDEESDQSFHTAEGSLPDDSPTPTTPPAIPPPALPRTHGKMVVRKYVDDTTCLEATNKELVVRHVSAARTQEQVPALGLQDLMHGIVQRAEEIGMRVNCSKTQLLCVSAENGCHTTASITVNGITINSEEEMKLLGFMIGASPGVGSHVDHIKAKFRVRFWTLIHLKRAGLSGWRLFRIYAAVIRPIIEANSVIYHSMLNKGQAKEIERMQKMAAKLCFGFHLHYGEILEMWGIDSLETRRRTAIEKFVQKTNSTNPRFATRWFRPRQEPEMNLRNRRPYVEDKAKTERFYNSPLLYMQRTLNDIVTAG